MDIFEQIKLAREITKSVKDYMKASISVGLRQPIKGVEEIPGDVHAFTVSIKAVQEVGGSCLSPETYDARAQREAISKMLDRLDPLVSLGILSALCESGKAPYFSGFRFHPEVLSQLKNIIAKFNEEAHTHE